MRTLILLVLLIAAWTNESGLSRAEEALEMSSKNLELKVEIPRLKVSEYHRPYVAIWIQDENDEFVINLALWYQIEGPTKDFGTKWLPDLRQWWRRSGRELEFPVDAISAPTRPVGEHKLEFEDTRLSVLSPGKYTLVIEAVREVGDRELLQIPFLWPSEKVTTYEAKGKKELGEITLTVKP